jgi:hypothetical protein
MTGRRDCDEVIKCVDERGKVAESFNIDSASDGMLFQKARLNDAVMEMKDDQVDFLDLNMKFFVFLYQASIQKSGITSPAAILLFLFILILNDLSTNWKTKASIAP